MLAKNKQDRNWRSLYRKLCLMLGKIVDYEDLTIENCEYFVKNNGLKPITTIKYIGLLKRHIYSNADNVPCKDLDKYKEIFASYAKRENTADISLSKEELSTVIEYDTSHFSKQNLAAWWMYCIMSLTGAEYKDAINFSTNNINYAKGEFYYIREANNRDTVIPMFKRLDDLLTVKPDLSIIRNSVEYKHLIPNVFSQMGFDNFLLYTPKSARSTFATLLWEAGCNESEISEFMGVIPGTARRFIVGYNKKLSQINLDDIF